MILLTKSQGSPQEATKKFRAEILTIFSLLFWDLVSNIINKEAYMKPKKASRKPQGSFKKYWSYLGCLVAQNCILLMMLIAAQSLKKVYTKIDY